jgi:hypothetical protein
MSPTLRDVLQSVGYQADESTQVMGLGLDELVDIDTSVLEFAEPEIDEFLRINGLPPMFPDLGPDVHRRSGSGAWVPTPSS